MRKMKKLPALLLSLLMVLSLITSCGSGNNTADSGTGGDTDTPEAAYDAVTIGTMSSMAAGHFDGIGLLSDNYCQPANYLVYDPLFYINEEGIQTSDILSSWEWNDTVGDNGGIVLTLKDYVYFSNGDQMDVNDLIWSINRASRVARTADNMARFLMDQATVSDDLMTLTIPMTEQYAEWQVLLSGIVIMNGDYIDANGGDDYDYTDAAMVVGSGPYAVESYIEDTSTTFVKRDDWWAEEESNGLASVNTITVVAYADTNTMMIDYENGVIDAAISLNYSDYDYVEADSALGTAVKVSTNCVVNLIMDVDGNEYLSDQNMRLAIAYALDGDALGQLAYGSLYSSAEGFVDSSNQFFVSGYTYEYDPEKAEEYLAQSDYAGETLTMVVTSGTNATLAEAIQSQLDEVGINLAVEVYDQATCVEKWLEEGSTCFLLDQTQNANSSNSFNTQYLNVRRTVDFPCYKKSDETWNNLLDGAMGTTDTEEQADYYAQFQEYAYEVCFAVPICVRYSAYAYGASGVIDELTIWDTTGPNLRYLTTNAVS